jgi:hypothetical protein
MEKRMSKKLNWKTKGCGKGVASVAETNYNGYEMIWTVERSLGKEGFKLKFGDMVLTTKPTVEEAQAFAENYL